MMNEFDDNTRSNTIADEFNPSEFAGDNFSPLPAGPYRVMIKEALFKTPKDTSKPDYLNIQFTVVGPEEYKGRTLFEIMNVNNVKSQVRAIAKNQLGNLCVAAGVGKFSFNEINRAMQDKMCWVTLALVDDDYTQGKRNKIKRYLSDQQAQQMLSTGKMPPAPTAGNPSTPDIPF